jgi:hypothetical protein
MRRLLRRVPALVVATAAAALGCSQTPASGPTDFISAPPAGSSGGRGGGTAGAEDGAGGTPPPMAPGSNGTTPSRTVEETDLYRVEGNRLYYLNAYRGFMVFDVSDVDHPRLLGRSAIYGSPVDMIVRNGVATVVIADWYGQMDDGTPFHGSVVRGLDARDPAHIAVLGEAKLGGWVRDDRVVGDVIYAVSEDYGWWYGWDYGVGGGAVSSGGGVSSSGGSQQETLVVSSVSFAGGQIKAVGKQTFTGYSGVFHVTSNAILLAHESAGSTTRTQLLYLDISDPAGAIVARGAIDVDGRVQGWGADNGRWNLDFADGKLAHVVGCNSQWCDGTSGYILSTVDFGNPDAPVAKPALPIAATGWSAAARFDSQRLYLSPASYGYWDGTSQQTTPFQVFDLSNPEAPALAGTVQIAGVVYNILPAPNKRLFALGNEYASGSDYYAQAVSVRYLDVSDPANPVVLGNSKFGEGWAWTPAAGTFKAFTIDADKGLVVLPFSGWSPQSNGYNNGLQLIEFTADSQRTAAAAKTRGWVERGIFVGARLVSLSDLALSVIDYADHDHPRVVTELTLARNVVTAQPQGATIAELSSDWWQNDTTTTEMRVLPIGNAEESGDVSGIPTAAATIPGINARVFRNGDLAYVVTDVRTNIACNPKDASGGTCNGRTQQVQVLDLAGGQVVPRGKITLPADRWSWWGWGWWGCYYYDWFNGADIVAFAADGLAFRRWEPIYDGQGQYVDENSKFYLVDLANPDAPAIASTIITDFGDGWWGNMRMVGDTLWVSHYEWFDRPGNSNHWTVRFYADRMDLSDRSHPRVGAKVNVPGLVIGGSASDPSILYTIDYAWDNDNAANDLAVVRVHDGRWAERLGRVRIPGYVGSTYIVGDTAYLSAQRYSYYGSGPDDGPAMSLHAIDLGDPRHPVDRVASDKRGWGWLLGVSGDRAVVMSGWGANGVDIYKLGNDAAPELRQFVRTRGWGTSSIARQDNALYLSSGYWGVQKVDLQ